MKIFLKIFETNKEEPYKLELSGNWALETMILKLSEKYFGNKCKEKMEDLLKGV